MQIVIFNNAKLPSVEYVRTPYEADKIIRKYESVCDVKTCEINDTVNTYR